MKRVRHRLASALLALLIHHELPVEERRHKARSLHHHKHTTRSAHTRVVDHESPRRPAKKLG